MPLKNLNYYCQVSSHHIAWSVVCHLWPTLPSTVALWKLCFLPFPSVQTFPSVSKRSNVQCRRSMKQNSPNATSSFRKYLDYFEFAYFGLIPNFKRCLKFGTGNFFVKLLTQVMLNELKTRNKNDKTFSTIRILKIDHLLFSFNF